MPRTPHCCWSTFAAPVNVEAGGAALEALDAGGLTEVMVVEADTVCGAGAELAVVLGTDDGLTVEVEAGAPEAGGRVMVTPPDRQYCCAKARVAGCGHGG